MRIAQHKIKTARRRATSPTGYMLLEAVLAITIFAISIAGIVWSLHESAKLQKTVERKAWVQEQFDAALTEALKVRRSKEDFEARKVIPLGEFGAEAVIEVEEIEKETQQGKILNNFYEIIITINYIEDDKPESKTLKTFHYWPIYQN